MIAAFDWLNRLMEAALDVVPQRYLVKKTHAGVKFKWGQSQLIEPGFHWWWPLTTQIDVYPTVIQTTNLENQTLTTSDGQVLGLSGIVRYRVPDVHTFLTEVWDGEDTIRDIVLSAISEYVEEHTAEELTGDFARIKASVGKELESFGIKVIKVSLSHFVVCKEVYGLWPAGGNNDKITKF